MPRISREEQLAELLHAGQILDQAGFCIATDGNFSARFDANKVLLTKSGIEKRNLSDASYVDLELACEEFGQASSEWFLHRALYQARPEIQCVLHVHSPYLTTFAASRRVPSTGLLAEAHVAIGEIVLVPFCTPGTRQLGKCALETSPTAMVYLLSNHGAAAVGSSVRDALHRLERAEFLARVAWQSEILGGGVPLTSRQLSGLSVATDGSNIPC